MRTLGRILMILVAFALMMGLMYMIVSASSSSANSIGPTFERGNGRGFQPEGGQSPFPNGQRPEFGHRDRRGGGVMFGMIRNVALIAIIVAAIVIPKDIWQKRMRNVSAGG